MAGQKASISGSTQIRAGVTSPRNHYSPLVISWTGAVEMQRAGIRLGDTVRIIRDPLFGKIGEVSGLPSDLTRGFPPRARFAYSK